jgi:hypothetical protein
MEESEKQAIVIMELWTWVLSEREAKNVPRTPDLSLAP